MDGKEYRQQMLDELSRTLNDLDDREIEQAVKEITTAKRTVSYTHLRAHETL